MLISISHHLLLNDLLYVFVCCFDSTIHLRPVGEGIMMLDFEVITQFFHHLVVQIRPIICNDLARDAVAANDLILDKFDHHLLGHISIRCSFDPLGEIVNSHENEAVSIGGFGFNPANHVDAPHRERLGRV